MSVSSQPILRPYGDHAILVEWATEGFDASISDDVHTLAGKLRSQNVFTEVMPGYDSVVASFDNAQMSLEAAKNRIEHVLEREMDGTEPYESRLVEIPVTYGGSDGPDLEALAEHSGKTTEDVIALHSGRDYRVCMMGFIPGFTFLSDVDPILQHPRHATPRAVVPAGSVGIANWQAGIYGLESPGGWQIIGRTELAMFDAKREKPFLVEAGDRVRFVPQ